MNSLFKFAVPLIGLLVFIVFNYRAIPSYNPFDNQFDVSIYKLVADNCDTVRIECGYWNLREKTGRLKTYYQFFGNDKKVVAKGCEYIIDTLFTNDRDDFLYNRVCEDSLLNLSFNIAELNQELEKFGYRFQDRYYYEVWKGYNERYISATSDEVLDTVYLQIKIFGPPKSSAIIRYLSYYETPYQNKPVLSDFYKKQ